MQKEQARLQIKWETRKDKIMSFPYYIVSATYATNDYYFVVSSDYTSQTALLSIFPFNKDMDKLQTITISLTDILPRKVISTIFVKSLNFKSTSSSINIYSGQFVLGYRSGQLIHVQYKDRQCKIKQRLNKSLKNEGFLSKASSALFGGQDSYQTYIKEPIKYFSHSQRYEHYNYIYQCGNYLILQKQINEGKENKLFLKHQSLNLKAFIENYDINKVIVEDGFILFGCNHYIAFDHQETNSAIIFFQNEISSVIDSFQRERQLIVSSSSGQAIFFIDFNNFSLKKIIKTEMPIRRLGFFSDSLQNYYLAIMPYQNYLLIYSINENKYCKLRGHRSYIGNIEFDSKSDSVVTAGMDRRISICKMKKIDPKSWIQVTLDSSKLYHIIQTNVVDQKFDDIFSTGQFNNSNKAVTVNYGFADVLQLNGYYFFLTYDSRMIAYSL